MALWLSAGRMSLSLSVGSINTRDWKPHAATFNRELHPQALSCDNVLHGRAVKRLRGVPQSMPRATNHPESANLDVSKQSVAVCEEALLDLNVLQVLLLLTVLSAMHPPRKPPPA
jgi:hypothetical protein